VSVHTRRYRTAAALAIAATAALSLAAAPANARPAPDRDRLSASISTCPTRSEIAREMRGSGMSAQGAKKVAVFAYRDSIHGA
jgi:hypothetical protein